jgi:hypothetical protein
MNTLAKGDIHGLYNSMSNNKYHVFFSSYNFFPKKGKSAVKFSFRFIFSSVFPGRMKDHLKPGGVLLVILGYVLFFLYIHS